jgi:GT2 family glycosyltransferase
MQKDTMVDIWGKNRNHKENMSQSPKADIVIISYSKDEFCRKTTEECLRSLLLSEKDSETLFNVIVIESQEGVSWAEIFPNVKTHFAPLPYGYHKFLNYGRKKGVSEWVALCNNDLLFSPRWFTKILKASEENPDCLSFSPLCPLTQTQYGINPNTGFHKGHGIRREISGWCIVQKREIYDKIGDLDERFFHWFCDNDYAMTLQSLDLEHILVSESIVLHHEKNIGKTTERVVETKEEMDKLTTGSQPIFQEKWKNYLK